MSKNSNRYPIDMERYCEKTGLLLVHRIGTILEQLGYHTWINKVQSNGVDLEVYKNGNLLIVAEVLNWSPYTRLSSKRKNAIVANLREYKTCVTVLIFTAMKNPEMLNDLVYLNIDILNLQNQLLPKTFYTFYASKKQTINRVVDSRSANKQIQSAIFEYIKAVNIQQAMSNLFN